MITGVVRAIGIYGIKHGYTCAASVVNLKENLHFLRTQKPSIHVGFLEAQVSVRFLLRMLDCTHGTSRSPMESTLPAVRGEMEIAAAPPAATHPRKMCNSRPSKEIGGR